MKRKLHVKTGDEVKVISGKDKGKTGKVVAVSGNTFTSEDGSFLKTYDKTGKKINTRSK